DPDTLAAILDALRTLTQMGEDVEIGLEVNPGEVTLERLKAYRNMGFNRVSIGMQSFQPKLLTFMSRIHSPEDAISAYIMARKAGFTNVSGDLIFAVPGQTRQIWESDLKQLIDLGPEHISTYSLTVEEGTALKRWVDAGHVHMLEESIDTGMYDVGRDLLERHGYVNYEVSNYSRPGYRCRHNLNYWTGVDYLGFGPSAHSFFQGKRWWNPRHLQSYITGMVERGDCDPEIETIDAGTAANEMILTRLRLAQGLDLDIFESRFGINLLDEKAPTLEKWSQELSVQQGHLRVTPAGWSLIDEISADLMTVNA
ncbi:MAG: radical SAM family heme chaperone HemW, partial [Candidatus Marinimicrobia bacterium]|nr:radical SAM family heme chaperone HemW [Candidatus Neomarinimicrobiota bacterium]